MDNNPINVEDIISKVNVPQNLKGVYDKAVLSGMRIMFDKNSHTMMLEQLEKEGPLPQKLADGIITLVFLLWKQSNKTLPPQLLIPLTVTLMLRAFEFLQKSGDPEATKEVLGEAMDVAVNGVMERAGVTPDMLQKPAGQGKAQGLIQGGKNG